MKFPDNIREVAKLLPDFMGFIFYPQSKRYVGDDFAIPEIPSSIKKVGVFVNASAEQIIDTVKKYKLDLVQLHGDESAEFCKAIRKSVSVIKAFGVDKDFSFSVLNDYIDGCDYFLFDTKTTGYGGSGAKFNWDQLKNYSLSKPFFLSGGLDLSDMPAIISLTSHVSNLTSIDVNSKFEIQPGLKDINTLKLLKNELPG